MGVKKLSPKTLRKHKGVSFVGVSTCFFVHDGKGKFFMAKRSNKARDERGTWEIGGGGLKWGRKVEDNLRRELKEEYNAEPLAMQFLGFRDVHRAPKDGPPSHWIALDYAVLVDPKTVKINEPDMFDDSGWFSLKALPEPLHSQQLPFFDKYTQAIQEIFSK